MWSSRANFALSLSLLIIELSYSSGTSGSHSERGVVYDPNWTPESLSGSHQLPQQLISEPSQENTGIEIKQDDPKPDPAAVFEAGFARFTVLTDSIIRMEWSFEHKYNDDASFTFINRKLTPPKVTQETKNDWFTLRTLHLELAYLKSSNVSFDQSNLKVKINYPSLQKQWSPAGSWNESLGGRLPGTVRTLDAINGGVDLNCLDGSVGWDTHCQLGLISRDGYVVIDDTNNGRFDSSDIPWLKKQKRSKPQADTCQMSREDRRDCGRAGINKDVCEAWGCCQSFSASDPTGVPSCFYSTKAYQDLYFFGHGHNYKLALQEFTQIAGSIPLPPRFAFGIFFSRYWAFNDIEEMSIVNEYEKHSVPLDVLVIDMDWHLTFYGEQGATDQAGQPKGWTGFTWDKRLFPNPAKFLSWVRSQGLKITVNLHPASGIQPWEDTYESVGKALGVDTSTKKYIPLQFTNRTVMDAWAQITLKDRMHEGIDFWWLDWQQGESWIFEHEGIVSVNPTFWLNHLFTRYLPKIIPASGKQAERPVLLHRWGGLGNHRYQVGFSGDVQPSWESLDFQPYFTVSAANVGYGYWSHDIGGHGDATEPELYTRWIQWGVFSPIFRTHCTKSAKVDRRIWLYPMPYSGYMQETIMLRWHLQPYIYTQAYQAHVTGLSAVHGLYYEWPEEQAAYDYKNQYLFGSDFIVAPVTKPVDKTLGIVSKEVWVPPGLWFDILGGIMLEGPKKINIDYRVQEIPLFARSGAIIPTYATSSGSAARSTPQHSSFLRTLRLLVTPGGDVARGRVYEDDGHSLGYLKKEALTQEFSVSRHGTQVWVSIHAAKGSLVDKASSRSYEVELLATWPAKSVKIGGSVLPHLTFKTRQCEEDYWTYDGNKMALVIVLCAERSLSIETVIEAELLQEGSVNDVANGVPRMLERYLGAKRALDDQWDIKTVYMDFYPKLLESVEMGMRISYSPETALSEIKSFQNRQREVLKEISKIPDIDQGVARQLVRQVDWKFALGYGSDD